MTHKPTSLFDWNIVGPAIGDSFKKLAPAPHDQESGHVRDDGRRGADHRRHLHVADERGFVAQLAVWLWFTVLFANFAEAVAEGRGKAQAATPAKGAQGNDGATPAQRA